MLVDTGHDFSLYKRGTIQRRVERRMALAGGGSTMSAYLESLRGDKVECGLLADDLLINVTSFFVTRRPSSISKTSLCRS